MTNKEIAAKLRKILWFSQEVWDSSGHLDFPTNYCRMKQAITELLLEIINAPDKYYEANKE